MTANNVTRMLESKEIPFTAFDLPAEKIGAVESAQLLGVPAGQVFKTIVVTRLKTGKPILAVIPGNREVDLKAVAAAVSEKKVQVLTLKEAEHLTGLLSGGISPLALLNRGFQILLDDSARDFDEIHISGGQRGLNIRLRVSDLIKLTNARLIKISHNENL
ncbi:MAG: aminoacyl-tRNA deacylase [Anaerolineaceae bacterium]